MLPATSTSSPDTSPFWSVPVTDLFVHLRCSDKGLAGDDARVRLAQGCSQLRSGKRNSSAVALLVSQFKSPIILILLFAVALSAFVKDVTNAVIILAIVAISGLLGFYQERGAADAVNKLLAIIETKTTLLRDGKSVEVPVEQIVPGDIVIINAGDIVPGDARLLESNNLFINEATLTGETFPVEKVIGVLAADTALSGRTNSLFTGSYAVSGTGTALIVKTGSETEFGKISESLKLKPPETDFERGVRRFGYLLMEVTLLLVVSIFAINVYLHRPVLESFLFALALAVGLTPQLLPAIITVNLAHGAKRMAEAKVIVKRLAAIENFGSMDVLCSDKTGTLTEGEVQVNSAVNVAGAASDKMLLYAHLNAVYQTGYTNPIDAAIVAYKPADLAAYHKLDEEPYDFVRKRLSVLVSTPDGNLLVTKGALTNVLDVCTTAENAAGAVVPLATLIADIQKQFAALSEQGFRVVGVAYRALPGHTAIVKDDECAMTFLGFLTLFDPVKAGTVETIKRLRALGISLKIITGDNRLVAAHVSAQAGIKVDNILTGPDLHAISAEALPKRVDQVELFAEIEPNQKEQLIVALKRAGHVVGYIGDGINDASALHVADVGISVANAVDVAKEAADIVLLEKDLAVLEQGVREGRITFANTLKYVFMATSANFGNMFSMAGASLFLPFLPLLPTQILLTNLMTDFPEMTIATDTVDTELVELPRRWDIGFIRRFMVVFGLANSACDYLTFGVLLLIMHASPRQFRTGWFIENVVTASLIVLVVRTRKPFWKSKPGTALLVATLATVVVTLVLPITPLARVFQFVTVPPLFMLALGLILIFYILVAEVAKRLFYRSEGRRGR